MCCRAAVGLSVFLFRRCHSSSSGGCCIVGGGGFFGAELDEPEVGGVAPGGEVGEDLGLALLPVGE